MNFESNLYNQAIFSTWPEIQDKNINILERKELLRWNIKHFHHFKGLSLKQIKVFLEVESPTLTIIEN